jgi:hypothetical protein
MVERDRHTKELAGGVGRFTSAGGQRRDLEVIRAISKQGCTLSRPSAIPIGADYADTNSLILILAHGGHILSL